MDGKEKHYTQYLPVAGTVRGTVSCIFLPVTLLGDIIFLVRGITMVQRRKVSGPGEWQMTRNCAIGT